MNVTTEIKEVKKETLEKINEKKKDSFCYQKVTKLLNL